ncbi:MAG: hypothetical protein ACRDK0_02780, partial [Solirubrobacteraceae bacterium]
MDVDGDHGRSRTRVLLPTCSLLALVAFLALGTGSASAQGGLSITHACTTIPASPAPDNCEVWYTAPTRLKWTVAGELRHRGCDTYLFEEDGQYERVCSADVGQT